MDAIDVQLRLGRAHGLTACSLRALSAALCDRQQPLSLQALFEQSGAVHAALREVDAARIDADRRWMERERISVLDLTSAHYPPQLLELQDAPLLLYVQGSVASLSAPQLAMVGSRSPTPPGRASADEFAAQLAQAGLTITSGLALGIDAASHEGALREAGRTIAVLATGLDQIYPTQHRALATRIAASGALVSEFPPQTPPRKSNFPRRNRIISGLSRALLVVEAASSSGSLLTARLACEQGRKVFAIPGSIRNLQVRGCHQLIRAGARLVEHPAQILQELQFSTPKQMLMKLAPREALDKEYEILLDAVGFEAASLDVLVDRTGLPSQSVASMLLILELQGAVGVQAGGLFVRL
jgi:DNA processing protein